ncbi:MAG: hypothetical protein JSV86_05625 [Gemmatimonadota bacterium]|nr:MAG: hypothetical protein JSV86_05625 [Gemmatimonadota bacterium]
MSDFLMENVVGPVIVIVVAAIVRHFELGKWKRTIGWIVEGVEDGTSDLPDDQSKKVKSAIKRAAEDGGVQDRLHAIVEKITKEKPRA